DLELQDNAGARALSWAVFQRDVKKTKLFLEKGAQVNFISKPGNFSVDFSHMKALCREDRAGKWEAVAFFPILLLDPLIYFSGPSCRNMGTDSADKYPHGYTTLDLAQEVRRSDYEHLNRAAETEIIELLKKYGAKSSKAIL